MKILGLTRLFAVGAAAFAVLAAGNALAQTMIKIATAYPPGNESTIAAEKFAELLKEYSKGKIEAQVFSGGSMGGERETIQAAKLNSVQAVTSGMMPIHMMAGEYAFLDVPFILRDYDHFKELWAGKIGDQVRKILADNKLKAMGIYYRGNRHTSANKPFKVVDDLKGVKMRVPQDPSWVKIWQAIGTLPTVVALPELFTALQTGVADASEGPASQLVSYRVNEVQKYLVKSGHLPAVAIMCMNTNFLDGLGSEERSIVERAAKDATAYADKWAQENETKLIQKLIDGGMTPVEADTAAWRTKAMPAIKELFATQWKQVTLEEVMK